MPYSKQRVIYSRPLVTICFIHVKQTVLMKTITALTCRLSVHQVRRTKPSRIVLKPLPLKITSYARDHVRGKFE